MILLLALLLHTSSAQPLSALTGFPGLDVASGKALAAALADDNTERVLVASDLRLEDADFAGFTLPILRRQNFTIEGVSELPPILDLNYVASKVMLASSATLTMKHVAIVNWRKNSANQAPGIDLLAPAAPVGTSALHIEESYVWYWYCFPLPTAMASLSRIIRPPEVGGTQAYALPIPVPPTRATPANCSVDKASPVMNRCIAYAGKFIDVVQYGADLLPSGNPTSNHYMVYMTDSYGLCGDLLPQECIDKYGALGCSLIYSTQSRPSLFPQLTTSPSPPVGESITAASGGAHASGGGDEWTRVFGAVLGGVVGGVGLVAATAGACFLWQRRYRRMRSGAGADRALRGSYAAAGGDCDESPEKPWKDDSKDRESGGVSGPGNPTSGEVRAAATAAAGDGERGSTAAANVTAAVAAAAASAQMLASDDSGGGGCGGGSGHVVSAQTCSAADNEDMVASTIASLAPAAGFGRVARAAPARSAVAAVAGTQKIANAFPAAAGTAAATTAAARQEVDPACSTDLESQLAAPVAAASLGPLDRASPVPSALPAKLIAAMGRALAKLGAIYGFLADRGAHVGGAAEAMDRGTQTQKQTQTLTQLSNPDSSGVLAMLVDTASPPALNGVMRRPPSPSLVITLATPTRTDVRLDVVISTAAFTSSAAQSWCRASGAPGGATAGDGVAADVAGATATACDGGGLDAAAVAGAAHSNGMAASGESPAADTVGQPAAADTYALASGLASSGHLAWEVDGASGAAADEDASNQVKLLPTVLGKGASARVYEGEFQGQRVAVKVFAASAFQESWPVPPPRAMQQCPPAMQHDSPAEGLAEAALVHACAAGSGAAVAAGNEQQQGAAAGMRNSSTAAADDMQSQDIRSKQFAQEAEILARVQHPCIVRLLAACTTPPRYCLVMERMETNLARLIYGRPGFLLPLPTVLHIAIQVAQGLEYLHPTIIHRDVKPANVLINMADSPRPVAKLSDFGLSRVRAATAPTMNPEAGTPAFVAPECYHVENEVVTHHVDIYALGVLMWAMLTGQEPWQGQPVVAVAYKVTVLGERLPLQYLGYGRCPLKLRMLIQECWDADPRRRPAAAEVAKRLLQLHEQITRHAGSGQQWGPSSVT